MPKTTKTTAKPKAAAKPKAVKSISLDDLNDDPTLLTTLKPADIKRLQAEAEKGQVPLGGNVRATLNGLFNSLEA